MALEMHCDDGVELLFAGVGEHPVADDARIVDQDVQTRAKRIHRGLNQTFGLRPVGDVGSAGDGFAAGGDDLIDDTLRGAAATRG